MIHYLFKTQCLIDGSAFFGIHSTWDLNWGENGFNYIGNGPKLEAKLREFGRQNFRTSIVQASTDRSLLEAKLSGILNDVKGHPLSLNVSPEEFSQTMSEALTGTTKAPEHKANIGAAMVDNKNALGKVVSEETKQALSEKAKAKNLKWIHNPETREEMQITKEEIDAGDMLTGFQLGRLPKELKKMGPKPSDPNKGRQFKGMMEYK